jgi:hypothetical protein
VRRACHAPSIRRASCFALVRAPVAANSPARASALPYTVNDGASFSGPAGGLTPQQIATAYSYDPSAGGTGQTVAIADAYDDPQIEADLATFDSQYGLPACTEANGCFEKVGQTGSKSVLPAADTSGWSVEIALDVETVHSVCQKCKILLVEANEPTYFDLAAAVNRAVAKGATEVSNSYGGPEQAMHASERAAYNHPGVVIAASTGDDGYYDWDLVDELVFFQGEWYFGESPEMPNVPASLPSVVAVGGTTLELTGEDTRASETVWNNNGPGDEVGLKFGFAQGATGGGCSTVFTAQLWQQSTPNFSAAGCGSRRLAADVAAVADPNTGFDVYDSYNCGSYCEETGLGKGWLTIGGTSLSAPLTTSLYALAGGSNGVEYPALTLYGHLGESSALFDVRQGADGFCGGESVAACGDPNGFFGRVDCEGSTACNAVSGFDGPSGVGTPNGLRAFESALPTAVIASPGSSQAGVAANFSAVGSSDPYPGGSISSYQWRWGDGTADSGGVSPTHTFATAGAYDVTLTVTDSYGQISQPATRAVVITAPPGPPPTAPSPVQPPGSQPQSNPSSGGVAGFQGQQTAPLPDVLLESPSLQASSSGVVTLKASCPVGESSCAGIVLLRTQGAVGAGVRKKTVLLLATRLFDIPGGQSKTVTLRLSPRARVLLTHAHVLKVRVTFLAHDQAGATHTTRVVTLLRSAKAHRAKH